MLCIAHDIRCAPNFEAKDFKPTDTGDGGIDLIAWHPMEDQREGIPLAFAQCGCSTTDWTFKQLEASPAAHRHHLPVMHVSFAASPFATAVTAYDMNEGMLSEVAASAEARGLANIVTRQGVAESLPFADGAFDVVATRYSAHHWRDVPLALRGCRRVLKKGGLLAVIDVVSPGGALLDTHMQAVELLRDTSHVRDYSIGEWTVMLNDAGFRLRKTETFPLRLEFASWVERMQTPEHARVTIRKLQEGAPEEVKSYFAVEGDGSFSVDVAMLECVCY